MLRYTTDRARPGLVALYDIRPGNGAGQFLQPGSPHGALKQSNRLLMQWILCPYLYSNLFVHDSNGLNGRATQSAPILPRPPCAVLWNICVVHSVLNGGWRAIARAVVRNHHIKSYWVDSHREDVITTRWRWCPTQRRMRSPRTGINHGRRQGWRAGPDLQIWGLFQPWRVGSYAWSCRQQLIDSNSI